ncbi:hypothetical protein Trydic_g8314 [Trypoxylus dichotomus]
MTTVFRLKRSLSEEPKDTVIINCKKLKTDNHESNIEESSIYKLATTSATQDQSVVTHIRHSTKLKSKIEENYKAHISNLYNKMKLQNEAAKKSVRYKVIDLHRAMATPSQETDVIVVDIEEDKEENVKEGNYVYDLYYADSCNLPEIDLRDLICVYPLSDELIYDNEYDNEIDTNDSDSNDENNWRNDYPDESDIESITEEDMINVMERLDMSEGNELSSDNEDNSKFVYDTKNEEYSNDDDADDVDIYGKMYSSFKAKVNKISKDSKNNWDVSDSSEHESNY